MKGAGAYAVRCTALKQLDRTFLRRSRNRDFDTILLNTRYDTTS